MISSLYDLKVINDHDSEFPIGIKKPMIIYHFHIHPQFIFESFLYTLHLYDLFSSELPYGLRVHKIFSMWQNDRDSGNGDS